MTDLQYEDNMPVIWVAILKENGKYIGSFTQKRFAQDFINLHPKRAGFMEIIPDYLVGHNASDYFYREDETA